MIHNVLVLHFSHFKCSFLKQPAAYTLRKSVCDHAVISQVTTQHLTIGFTKIISGLRSQYFNIASTEHIRFYLKSSLRLFNHVFLSF